MCRRFNLFFFYSPFGVIFWISKISPLWNNRKIICISVRVWVHVHLLTFLGCRFEKSPLMIAWSAWNNYMDFEKVIAAWSLNHLVFDIFYICRYAWKIENAAAWSEKLNSKSLFGHSGLHITTIQLESKIRPRMEDVHRPSPLLRLTGNKNRKSAVENAKKPMHWQFNNSSFNDTEWSTIILNSKDCWLNAIKNFLI